MNHHIHILKYVFWFIVAVLLVFFALSIKKMPEKISYGISFSKYHSDELQLPWKEVFTATLDDMKVRHFRLSAHWPMIEPQNNQYFFDDLDYQMEEADKRGADVILSVGRRLPGWPECHVPDWAKELSWEDQKKEILEQIEKTVTRYREYDNIKYWQVENEPFLSVFAKEHCGELDRAFLDEEIALVKTLDPDTEILVTDSGNLGLWKDAWKRGDAFGTSVYLYLWNPTIGQVRTVYSPLVYRAKANLMKYVFGNKDSLLIELSLEPWLLEPIVNSPLETQLTRMSIDKFSEVIHFAKKTGFEEQYLWGAEWWYFMKEKGYPEYWDAGKALFSK